MKTKKILSTILAVILLLSMLSVVALPVAAEEPEPEVFFVLQGPSGTVDRGETFEVKVYATGRFLGVTARVDYDENNMVLTGVQKNNTLLKGTLVEDMHGLVYLNLNLSDSVLSNDLAFTLTFLATGPGTTDIDFIVKDVMRTDGSNNAVYIEAEVTEMDPVTVEPSSDPAPLATAIALNPLVKVLERGDVYTLGHTLMPSNANDTVLFLSNKTNVAEIGKSTGVVQSIDVGVAKLMAYANTAGVNTSAHVIVHDDGRSNMIITPEESLIDLDKGQSETLEYTIEPKPGKPKPGGNYTITFLSSDPSIVAVDPATGEITVVGDGMATIYLAGSDGSYSTCDVNDPRTYATKIAADAVTVQAGETAQINYTLTPNDAEDTLKFTSDAPTVATVDSNGVITGVGEGTATITIQGRKVKTTCTVTVTATAATSITAKPATLTIAKGQTGTVGYTLTPSNATDTVTFSSSDPSIATVNPNTGVVTGVKAGKTTITIQGTKVSATCAVTVTNYATAIALSATSMDLIMGKTGTLKYTLTPSDASDTITFTSANKNIATVTSSGVITGVKAGTVQITVKSANKTAVCTVTVHNYVTLKIGSTKAIVNGTKTTVDSLGTKPFKISGSTMVPVRFVGDKMGGKTTYTSATAPIILKYEGITVSIKINDKKCTVTEANGKTRSFTMTRPATKVSGKVYIPLRAVAESLGFTVYYQSGTEYIVINNPKMGTALRNTRLAEAVNSKYF